MTYLESQDQIPFRIRSIQRIQVGQGFPLISGKDQSVWIVLKGRLEIEVDDSRSVRNFLLDRPNRALYIPPGVSVRTQALKAPVTGLIIHSEEYNLPDEVAKAEADSRISECQPWTITEMSNDPNACLKFPFPVERIYYLYNISPGAHRGYHAHKELQGIMIAAAGSFEVELSDGKDILNHTLSNPNEGLFIPHMIWRVIRNFSSDAVCLVFASGKFADGEMIYDYNEFLKLKGVD
jgi:uncharacterized RmlC-like cupin family protein